MQLVQRRAHSKALCGWCRRERAPSASTLAPSAEGCDARASRREGAHQRHRRFSCEFLGARPLRKRLNLAKRPPTPRLLSISRRSLDAAIHASDASFVFLHSLKANFDVELGRAQVTHKHGFKKRLLAAAAFVAFLVVLVMCMRHLLYYTAGTQKFLNKNIMLT